MSVRNLRYDIIAVWKRPGDGLELHLRRDGKVFYFYPPSKDREEGELEDASGNGACTIDSIETWITKGESGAGFDRLVRMPKLKIFR